MNGYLSPPGGQRVPVADGLTIGRVKGCGLLLRDPKASRHHARLIVEASVVEIEDLESSNGTLVNGKPIRRRMLRSGDVIQIGTSLITYRDEESESVVADASPPEPTVSPRAPDKEVIEFVDESVEVKTAVARGPRPQPAALGRHRSMSGKGVLRDDIRQMGSLQRLVVVLLVVLAAAALGYGAFRLVAGS